MLSLRFKWLEEQRLNKDLTRTELQVLDLLCHQKNFSNNLSLIKNETACKKLNISRRTYQRGINGLIKKEIIIRERRYKNGKEIS